MIFFILSMGCRSENNIKEEIVVIETVEEKTKSKPVYLQDMVLVRQSRLSVTPVTENEWNIILRMAQS